mmetsp:Transcript_57131/g.99909  ORF Transcript_57131/g.99909 Transcript_57131/m.99909 type:complete len:577 (+) Transcript_57131:71-1801(+)
MAPSKRTWHQAAGGAEDLQLTPAEREERAKAADAACARLDEEAARFEAEGLERFTVGGDPESPHMIVIGGGLVGALCATDLLAKGFKVTLYERYQDIRSIPQLGRSINLSVTSRGLRAIKSLGGTLYDDVLKIARPVTGRIIHLADGQTLFQRYGKDDTEYNYAISRFELNKLLLEKAAEAGADLHFNYVLSETSDFGGDEAVGCTLNFTREDPNAPGKKQCIQVNAACPVIACDGAGSRIRYAMRHAGLTNFEEDLLTQGYKEVLFPNPGENDFGAPGSDGGEACPGIRGLHIWPRGNHFLMALPNIDGSFTGTIYMEMKGDNDSFASLSDRAACADFCEKHYGAAAPLVGGLDSMVSQVSGNPVGLLGTVRCDTWAARGRVILIGDSSHAMVPFFGQGCNCGFEDVSWLSRFLDEHCGEGGKIVPAKCTAANYEACFAALEAERKPNANAICDMALENMAEMGSKTADTKFRAMKKVENKLENNFGSKFRSRYAMVCYGGDGNVSYANAKSLGVVQQQILEKLCEDMAPEKLADEEGTAAEVEKVDMDRALALIDELLRPAQEALKIDLTAVKY